MNKTITLYIVAVKLPYEEIRIGDDFERTNLYQFETNQKRSEFIKNIESDFPKNSQYATSELKVSK